MWLAKPRQIRRHWLGNEQNITRKRARLVIEDHVIALLRKHDPRLTNQEAELATADLSAEMTRLLGSFSAWDADEISAAAARAADELLTEEEEENGAAHRQ
jgi:hypothetical protein